MNNKIGGDAVKLTASKIVTTLIGLVSAMLLSRFRSLEEYGTYSQLLLTVNLFSTVFMLGLPNSINFFLARAETPQEKQKFLSVYYTLSTFLSIVTGTVLICAEPLIASYFNNPKIDGFIYFLCLYPWASIVSSSIENMFIVYHKTNYLMVYRVLNSVSLLGIILIVQLLGWGFDTYVALLVTVNVVFAFAVYVIAGKLSGGICMSFNKSIIKAILVFSIPLGLASVVGTLDIEIDKLLIGKLMSTEQLAIYSNASKELPVSIISASLTAVLLPQLTIMLKHEDTDGAVKLWGKAIELSYIIICFIVAGVFTYAKDAMTLLYSEKYLPGLQVFRVYSLTLLLRCTYWGIILNARGKSKSILYCSIASLVLNIVLNPLFYNFWGMIGPAIATFVSILAVLLAQLLMTSRCIQISFLEVFPWKSVGIITAINIGFSLAFAAIKATLPLERVLGSLAESLVLGIIWGIGYILVMKKTIKSTWDGLNETAYKDA